MVCDVHNANVDKNAFAILIGSNLIAESAVRYMAFLSVIFDRNGNFKTIFHSDNTTMQKTLISRRYMNCVYKVANFNKSAWIWRFLTDKPNAD